MVTLRALPLSALLLVTILPFSPASEDAAAGNGLIQPGDFVAVGGAGCTLNFVYDGIGVNGGKVYMGTAAHCVGSVGQAASTDGYSNFGTVAFIRSACCAALDYAFIEVKPQYHSVIDPSVRGHPDFPTGYTTSAESGLGDLIYISGWGMGFNVNGVLRHQRIGVVYGDNADTYTIEGPIIFGDSGGPLTHESGKAYGVVSRIVYGTILPPGGYQTGPSIEQVLSDAAASGFPLELRTV